MRITRLSKYIRYKMNIYRTWDIINYNISNPSINCTYVKDNSHLSELSISSIKDRLDWKIRSEDGLKRYYIDKMTLASMKDYYV